MKPAILLAAFLAAGAALQAQLPSSQAKVDTTGGGQVLTLPPVAGCPVSMQAKQAGMTDMVRVKEGQKVDPETLSKPGQRIRLMLAQPPNGRKIASATVTATGLTARNRLRKTEYEDGPDDVRRTLHITFSGENGEFTADLILPGFTAVQSIRLDSLTYADDSTWKIADHQTCTVTPDPFMLIADR